MNTTDLPQLIVSQIQIMGCEVQVLAPYGRPIIWSILGKSSCHHNNNEKDEKNQSQDQEILLTFMILMKTYRFFFVQYCEWCVFARRSIVRSIYSTHVNQANPNPRTENYSKKQRVLDMGEKHIEANTKII